MLPCPKNVFVSDTKVEAIFGGISTLASRIHNVNSSPQYVPFTATSSLVVDTASLLMIESLGNGSNS